MPNFVFYLTAFLLVGCSGIQPRYHEVEKGETLSTIAKNYRVPMSELKDKNSDALAEGLHPGEKLYIPFESRSDWDRDLYSDDPRPTRPDVPTVTNAKFVWPVSGSLSSLFGRRKLGRSREKDHEGIDIVARHGAPVRAARSGHIIYASNRIKGYGNMVIIRHADTLSTVYAHLSRFKVKRGQFVSRGQVLGLVGKTGHATSAHLHFEIRDQQTPIDPLLHLQGQYAHNILGR